MHSFASAKEFYEHFRKGIFHILSLPKWTFVSENLITWRLFTECYQKNCPGGNLTGGQGQGDNPGPAFKHELLHNIRVTGFSGMGGKLVIGIVG